MRALLLIASFVNLKRVTDYGEDVVVVIYRTLYFV